MPQFKVTDPSTGKTLLLEGDSAPTEQELEQAFAGPYQPPGQTASPLLLRPDAMAPGVVPQQSVMQRLGQSLPGQIGAAVNQTGRDIGLAQGRAMGIQGLPQQQQPQNYQQALSQGAANVTGQFLNPETAPLAALFPLAKLLPLGPLLARGALAAMVTPAVSQGLGVLSPGSGATGPQRLQAGVETGGAGLGLLPLVHPPFAAFVDAARENMALDKGQTLPAETRTGALPLTTAPGLGQSLRGGSPVKVPVSSTGQYSGLGVSKEPATTPSLSPQAGSVFPQAARLTQLTQKFNNNQLTPPEFKEFIGLQQQSDAANSPKNAGWGDLQKTAASAKSADEQLHDRVHEIANAYNSLNTGFYADLKQGKITQEQYNTLNRKTVAAMFQLRTSNDVVKGQQDHDAIQQEGEQYAIRKQSTTGVGQQPVGTRSVGGQGGQGVEQGDQGKEVAGQGQAGSPSQTQTALQGQVQDVGQRGGTAREGVQPRDEGRVGSVQGMDKTGQGGFVLLPEDFVKKLGFAKDFKVQGEMLFNRMRNLFGEKSSLFQALQSAGLGQYLKEKRTPQEVEKWAQENGPKVEVRKFRASEESLGSEVSRLQHELETNHKDYILGGSDGRSNWYDPNDESKTVHYAKPEDVPDPKVRDILMKYREAYKRYSPEGDRSHWQSIAPKSEQDMPGYVEIAVVKPARTREQYFKDNPDKKEVKMYADTDTSKVQEDLKFPSTHSFPPNTLGFVRGYMETNAKGEKVFHVIEVQSDWAQQAREQKEMATRENMPINDQNYKSDYVNRNNETLLPHYERLALKAAIEHAREQGATKIAISDAETAMMTEGHDKIAAMVRRIGDGKVQVIRPDTGVKIYDYNGKEKWSEALREAFPTYESIPDISERASIPLQNRGMRLHYDRTLPKIAEELTGSRGERVSFGEHKMAFPMENEAWHTDAPNQTRNDTSIPRKDLIFRNPDGTPKTDVSARSYDISKLPSKEPTVFGKRMTSESGSVISPAEIVRSIKDKLMKNVDTDMLSAIAGSHVMKAQWLRQQGVDVPRTAALNPKVADALVDYAASETTSHNVARSLMTDVLGKHNNDEQFRKQLGGVIYEDMRRAAGEKGNPVWKLKNSPFKDEAQFKAALINPEFKDTLEKWKDLIQSRAEAQHTRLGGSLAETGETTGAFANLKAILKDSQEESTGLGKGTPLTTLKKGSVFSKERKFTGSEYELDARQLGERMIQRNWSEVKKQDFYDTAVKEGLAKWLEPGDKVPGGHTAIPVTRRSLVILKEGEKPQHVEVSSRLAVDNRILPEVKQAFQTDSPLQNATLKAIGGVPTKVQVAAGIDAGVHSFNDVTALDSAVRQKFGQAVFGLRQANTVTRLKKSISDVLADSSEVQKEIADMSLAGVTFRSRTGGGYSSRMLNLVDTATRLALNRLFDEGVKTGAIKDTPENRRRFINGQAGQYNKRLMSAFQQQMQESGLGSFNVAGRTFNRLTVRRLFASPSVEATSAKEQARMRLSQALGLATAVVAFPYLANMALTGQPTGREGTKFGQVDLGPEFDSKDGKREVLDMAQVMGLRRAGRATGLGALMSDQIEPRLKGEQPASWGQTLKQAGSDIVKTAASPFVGPLPNVASTLTTGKSALGYEQRAPGEKGPPYYGAAFSALNPLVGSSTGLGRQQGSAETLPGRVAQRLGQIVGVRQVGTSSVISNLARQFNYKLGKTDQTDYAPSEYIPLKEALAQGKDVDAKAEYEQLVDEKMKEHAFGSNPRAEAEKAVQEEFTRMSKPLFTGSKENEAAFVKTLTPEQKKLYDEAVAKQQETAQKFFDMFPKQQKNKGFKMPHFRRFSMNDYEVGQTISRGGKQYTVTGFDEDGMPLVEQA